MLTTKSPEITDFSKLTMAEDWADSGLKSAAKKKAENEAEVLLIPNNKRFVLFPIEYNQVNPVASRNPPSSLANPSSCVLSKVWEMYKHIEAHFWSAEEIELSDDFNGKNNPWFNQPALTFQLTPRNSFFAAENRL